MNISKYKRAVFPLVTGGLLLVGLLLWLNGPPPTTHAAPGDVYCVTPGGGTYPACDQVFITVQAAVDAATGGEEIRVATGTYTGVQARPVPDDYPDPPASGLITQVVYINKTVTVRGGYTTPFSDPPNPEANPTTLNAQGQGRVIVVAGDISPTIEGLRITDGNAAGLSSYRDSGGGMYIVGATATISDNRVFVNTAAQGGGLYLHQSAAALNGNTVSANTANDGGGLYLTFSNATLNGTLSPTTPPTPMAAEGYTCGPVMLHSVATPSPATLLMPLAVDCTWTIAPPRSAATPSPPTPPVAGDRKSVGWKMAKACPL